MHSSSFFPFLLFLFSTLFFILFLQGMHSAVRAARHPVYLSLHANLYVGTWYLQLQGCK